MANSEQTSPREQPIRPQSSGPGPRVFVAMQAGQPQLLDESGTDDWQPVAGTRFYSRNGIGLYERLTETLYLRVDEGDPADAEAVVDRFRVASGMRDENRNSTDDAWAEEEATNILARIDRELVVEEALTRKLIQRYGLAV